MRTGTVFILLLFLCLAWPCICFPQTTRFDPLKDDISTRIPPLTVLLDSAVAHNHYVKFRSLQVDVNQCKLQTARAEWTRNFGIQGNVGYGNLYNYSSNSSNGVPDANFATSRSETKYSGAFYINMPLYTILGRHNAIKMAKTEIEQARAMAGEQADETRQLVIRQYNEVMLKQRLLRIRTKYLETANINMQMVEKEFSNGIVSVTEYTRISEIYARAESDFENVRTEFLTSYMLLEEMVGMKFHLNNNP